MSFGHANSAVEPNLQEQGNHTDAQEGSASDSERLQDLKGGITVSFHLTPSIDTPTMKNDKHENADSALSTAACSRCGGVHSNDYDSYCEDGNGGQLCQMCLEAVEDERWWDRMKSIALIYSENAEFSRPRNENREQREFYSSRQTPN